MYQSSKNSSFYSYEDLAFKSDEELRKIYINIRSNINKAKRNKSRTKVLEVELCYIQKEIQDRRYSRKKIKR
jgi:hypothetical protein